MSYSIAGLSDELKKLCDFSSPEMASYILSLGSQLELEEYMFGMLGKGAGRRDVRGRGPVGKQGPGACAQCLQPLHCCRGKR